VNAACASCEPGCARLGEERGDDKRPRVSKPGGARGGGSCQVNAACAICEPGCARGGEVGRERKRSMAADPGASASAEWSGERITRNLQRAPTVAGRVR
jgi:hypothetical protein